MQIYVEISKKIFFFFFLQREQINREELRSINHHDCRASHLIWNCFTHFYHVLARHKVAFFGRRLIAIVLSD